MPKTKIALTAVLAMLATTLYDRQRTKRRLDYITRIHLQEIDVQSRLAYNHGFGDGHALGVKNERQHALLKATIPSMN